MVTNGSDFGVEYLLSNLESHIFHLSDLEQVN